MSTLTANELNIENIHNHALMVAQNATNKFIKDELGGVDRAPCGFARVRVFGVKGNTKLGRTLKTLGFKPAWDGGLQLWNPSQSTVQNVDAKFHGAEAYANVLQQFGISATPDARLD